MQRLFVAIDLPDEVCESLRAIQPPPQSGLRLTSADQMHLTLHFLGETAREPVIASLGTLQFPRFPLAMDSVGEFRAADGGAILWAGFRHSRELLDLHTAVAAVLAPSGFRAEKRRYHPHVTLARCRSHVSRPVIQAFVRDQRAFSTPEFPVDHIALYSSTLLPDGPVYQREWQIDLRSGERGDVSPPGD